VVCAEKMRLLAKYVATTSALFVAMNALGLKTGAEFRKALAASKAARAQCAKARRALLNHKAQHRC